MSFNQTCEPRLTHHSQKLQWFGILFAEVSPDCSPSLDADPMLNSRAKVTY